MMQTMMQNGFFGFGSGMMILMAVIIAIPVWRICSKAGYSGWLSLLILVPIANLILLYFLGFSDWPLERRQASNQVRKVPK
jgi:hypothetical protein